MVGEHAGPLDAQEPDQDAEHRVYPQPVFEPLEDAHEDKKATTYIIGEERYLADIRPLVYQAPADPPFHDGDYVTGDHGDGIKEPDRHSQFRLIEHDIQIFIYFKINKVYKYTTIQTRLSSAFR